MVPAHLVPADSMTSIRRTRLGRPSTTRGQTTSSRSTHAYHPPVRYRRLRRHLLQGDARRASYDIQLNKTSRNSILLQTNINNTRSDIASSIKVLADIARRSRPEDLREGRRRDGRLRRARQDPHQDVPDLPNFSRFHDGFRENPKSETSEGDMRTPFYTAYGAENCTHITLISKEIDRPVKSGPEPWRPKFVIRTRRASRSWCRAR